jgi:secreted trypsin-like serine protease
VRVGEHDIRTTTDCEEEGGEEVCAPPFQDLTIEKVTFHPEYTGWRYTETGRPSPDLLQVELPIVPLGECKVIYKNLPTPITLNDNQICAGGKRSSDFCGGNGGGPLHALGLLFGEVRRVQQGIVSFGPTRCGEEPIPGVYTRVAAYMDWVLDNIAP